jgi:hypothetical protein
MKTFSVLAIAAPVAAFTSQSNVARQSATQISETKVRSVVLQCSAFPSTMRSPEGYGHRIEHPQKYVPCRTF